MTYRYIFQELQNTHDRADRTTFDQGKTTQHTIIGLNSIMFSIEKISTYSEVQDNVNSQSLCEQSLVSRESNFVFHVYGLSREKDLSVDSIISIA